MFLFLTLASLAFVGGVWLMFREISHAPTGYQDDEGFHTEVRVPAKPLRARVEPARAA